LYESVINTGLLVFRFMKLKNMSFVFILLFSVFGFVIFSYLAHEISHWQDLKDVAVDDRICFRVSNFSLFGENTDGASYRFFPKEGAEEEVERIERYTELKAYGLDVILLVLFCICFSMVIWNWYSKDD